MCIVEREGVRWREAAVGRRQKESTALSGLGGDATALGRQIEGPPPESSAALLFIYEIYICNHLANLGRCDS